MTSDETARASRRNRCVRCGEKRDAAVPIAHPRLDAYTCARCGYINLAAGKPESLPLPQSLDIAGAQSLRQRILDTRDAGAAEGIALFREIVAALAGSARKLVEAAPAFARASVPRALWLSETEFAKYGGRPQGNDLARTGYAKAAALLFALAAHDGPANLDAPEPSPATPDERAFQQSFWPVATDASGAGSILHQCLRGDAQVSIRNGEFAVQLTELGLDINELLLNRRAGGPNDSYADEQIRELHRALQLWRGIDLRQMLKYLVDGDGKHRAGLVTMPKAVVAPAARATLDAFEFTADRVRSFDDAWFLDLAPRRAVAADDQALCLSLVTRNWSAYYPVFSALRGDRPIYMMGAQGVAIALDNLMSSKNRLLQELTGASPGDVPAPTLTQLRQIRVELNRHAEARAQRVLIDHGWQARTGENWAVGGASEEIDVLAARAGSSAVDVLVGEVKDFDFTLHRISGPLGLTDRIRAAEAQLQRKHTRVIQSIGPVLQRLGIARHSGGVQAHALLITADAPPPGMFNVFDGADFASLARFSQLLATDRDLALRMFGRATRTLQS